jgi:hypothetical protein
VPSATMPRKAGRITVSITLWWISGVTTGAGE